MLDPAGTAADPRQMWNSLCEDEPGMRCLLDAYAAHPALRHGDLLNSDLLRRATGFSVEELASRPAPLRSHGCATGCRATARSSRSATGPPSASEVAEPLPGRRYP